MSGAVAFSGKNEDVPGHKKHQWAAGRVQVECTQTFKNGNRNFGFGLLTL